MLAGFVGGGYGTFLDRREPLPEIFSTRGPESILGFEGSLGWLTCTELLETPSLGLGCSQRRYFGNAGSHESVPIPKASKPL